MKHKKRLAAKVLGASLSKVFFAEEAQAEISKAITRSDMRGLIAVGKVALKNKNHRSRGRARKLRLQKRKGRQRGHGSRKGGKHSLVSRKDTWKARIRVQRRFLRSLLNRQILSHGNYRLLYVKSKGGFFRNLRHVKLYLTEHKLIEASQVPHQLEERGGMNKT